MLPLKKQQNLCCKRRDTKSPWKGDSWGKRGCVRTAAGSTVVPWVGEASSKYFSSSGTAQFLGPKEDVISLPPRVHLSCNYWGGNSVWGGSPFLLFWSDCFFLETGKQPKAWLAKAVASAKVDRRVPSLGWCSSPGCSSAPSPAWPWRGHLVRLHCPLFRCITLFSFLESAQTRSDLLSCFSTCEKRWN